MKTLLFPLVVMFAMPLWAAEGSRPNLVLVLADDKYDDLASEEQIHRETSTKMATKSVLIG